MIKRLHKRKSHGTLVANPGHRRRKRRNGSKKRRRLSAMHANPGHTRRRKRKNGSTKLSHYFARKGHKKAHRRRRRNPDGAGVDLVSIGVGSVVAIAAGAVGQAIFNQYLADSITSPALREAAPSLIVAGAAFAANKYVQNAKVKQIAKVTMMLAIFKALDKAMGNTIEEAVSGILPGGDTKKKSSGSGSGSYVSTTTSKGYLPVSRGLAGAYVNGTGGAYMNGPIMPGANLYGL